MTNHATTRNKLINEELAGDACGKYYPRTATMFQNDGDVIARNVTQMCAIMVDQALANPTMAPTVRGLPAHPLAPDCEHVLVGILADGFPRTNRIESTTMNLAPFSVLAIAITHE
jgi:hypothetical protein